MNAIFVKYLSMMAILLLLQPSSGHAQQNVAYRSNAAAKTRPYRLLTEGRQVTIRCTQRLESVMVWTSGGHRVIEQKDIKKEEFQFQLTVPARVYFIMIRLSDGSSYSEKFGVQQI